MYCQECGASLSLLGLKDRQTGYIQYYCNKCQIVWLVSRGRIIFKKVEDELS